MTRPQNIHAIDDTADVEVPVLIIGAGPSGLAAAHELVKLGIRPVIIEQSDCVGGLMRSIKRGAFTVDLGRKELYSRIPEVDAFWDDLLAGDYASYPHRIGSLYGNRILEMSGTHRGYLRGAPLSLLFKGGGGLARAWLTSGARQPANYEEYWYLRTGKTFARAFSQGYWEKFRGQHWRDMPVPSVHADDQPVSYSFAAIAHGLKLASKGGPANQRAWRHPSLGTGQICEIIAQKLAEAGVEIRLNTSVVGIDNRDGHIQTVLTAGPGGPVRYRPANLITSLQLPQLDTLMPNTPSPAPGEAVPDAARRSVILTYLFLDEAPRFPHAWLEVNDTALSCGRITNFAAFSGKMVPPGKTALCIEYFLNATDPVLSRNDEEWTAVTIQECARAGLIDPGRITDTMVVRLMRCNAAASWREAENARNHELLGLLKNIDNLYHVNRPGTDWATYAGLMAARAIAEGNRAEFDIRTDPARSYAASQRLANTRKPPRAPKSVKLMHAITSVSFGGAQAMLAKLFEHDDGNFQAYDQSVLSLMRLGELKDRFDGAGVPLSTLKMRAGIPSLSALARLMKLTFSKRPDILMGWMHHGSIAAWYSARMLRPQRAVIWNVRRSLTDISHEKPLTRFLLRHTAKLSPRVDAIIFNAHVAMEQYRQLGYRNAYMSVIPNGFDCDYYYPRPDAREKLRQIFGIDDDALIIGMVARYHPMKDPANLVEAFRQIRASASGRKVHLLIVGTDMHRLARHIGEDRFAGLEGSYTLADERLDVAEWMPGLDLLVLPSAWGEGFPNVIGEAMASGVPCVATDIGDSAWVIGDESRIVEPGNAKALAAAIARVLDLSDDERRGLGLSGRQRIIDNFSIDSVVRQYTALYDEVWERWQRRQR